MLLLGYLYHIVLGGEAMAVDIAIFVAVMVFGFWFSTRFSGPFHGAKWMVPILLVVGMGILIAPFTLWPPGPYPIHRFVQDWGLVPDPLLMLGSP